MANAMMVIHPYRDRDMWVFDDEAAGLVREPFVFGVPEMIDAATDGVADAENGFRLLFSASPFPGFQHELVWIREDYEGNWYRWSATGQEGWLCPALFKYFEKAPAAIFCRIEPRASQTG